MDFNIFMAPVNSLDGNVAKFEENKYEIFLKKLTYQNPTCLRNKHYLT